MERLRSAAFQLRRSWTIPTLPGYSRVLVQNVDSIVASAGYSIRPVRAAALTAASAPAGTFLVLPQAQKLPIALDRIVERLLRSGGSVVALGVPAWQTELRGPALTQPAHWLFQSPKSIAGWKDTPEHFDRGGRYELHAVTIGGRRRTALHAVIRNDGGFDPFGPAAPRSGLFHRGDSVTVICARAGDGHTRALSVLWEERDGSKWSATVPLTENWRRYRIPAASFRSFFTNTAAQSRRGFQPAETTRFLIALPGFSRGDVPGTASYWLLRVGTAPANPQLDARIVPRDILAPNYKFFESHRPLILKSRAGGALPLPAGRILSVQARPDSGFDKGRAWRQIALATTYDARTGVWRGSPVNLYLALPARSALLTSTIADPAFYADPNVRALFVTALRDMQRGAFLLDGGAQYYTVFPHQALDVGARIVNLRAVPRDLTVRVTISANGKPITAVEWPVRLQSNALAVVRRQWMPPPKPAAYRLTAQSA